MPRYLVFSFTEKVVIPSFIIGFLFSVLPNTIACVLGHYHLVSLTPIIDGSYCFCLSIFAFISNSLRLLPPIRMHRSSAYAAKSVMFSSLSRKINRLFRHVFHNMDPIL